MEVISEPLILHHDHRGHNKNTEMLYFSDVGKMFNICTVIFIQNFKYLFWTSLAKDDCLHIQH